MRDRFLSLLILLLTPQGAAAELYGCLSDEVRIIAPDGTERARYGVSVADEPTERERGLMFVEQLPKDQGMLFLFDQPAEVGFWMRNTLIPLDLLFIDQAGLIVRVHPDAIPHDETPIWSGGAVTGVLEVNAGEAVRNGIVPGDLAGSPFFLNGCGASGP
jgi:hypothetical protein